MVIIFVNVSKLDYNSWGVRKNSFLYKINEMNNN